MFNPYQQFPINNQQIVKVNGTNGANAYQLMPNSSALLLDESAPRVFLKQTDGAGFPTITAYKLEPYVEEKQPDINDLSNRIKKLEEMFNAKSNTSNVKRKQSTESESAKDTDD